MFFSRDARWLWWRAHTVWNRTRRTCSFTLLSPVVSLLTLLLVCNTCAKTRLVHWHHVNKCGKVKAIYIYKTKLRQRTQGPTYRPGSKTGSCWLVLPCCTRLLSPCLQGEAPRLHSSSVGKTHFHSSCFWYICQITIILLFLLWFMTRLLTTMFSAIVNIISLTNNESSNNS